MKRREAREVAFALIYEAGFCNEPRHHEEKAGASEETAADYRAIYDLALACREYEEDPYVRGVYFDIWNHIDRIDALIIENSQGWKAERLSKVSLAIMRLCVYEMLYREDVPYSIAINEAVELAKKYDHDKAPRFINGVVNAIAEKEGLKV